MLDLYGSGDPATFKLTLCLEELGLPYRFHALDLDGLGHWQPGHRRLAPQGEVPVLVDGPTVMTDATIALLYLAESNPSAGLLPSQPTARYAVQAIDDVLDGALLAGVNLLGWHARTRPEERAAFSAALAAMPGRQDVVGWSAVWRDAESDRLERAREKIRIGIGKLEQALGAGKWLSDGVFGIADICAYALVEGVPALLPEAISPAATPALAAWLDRVRARPAVARAAAGAGRSGVGPAHIRYAPPR